MPAHLADSRYAWTRLFVTLALMTIGSGAMYVVAVVLPAVQTEFRVARADASLPYTLMMVGFGLGGIAMGKLADRFGVMRVVLIGAAGPVPSSRPFGLGLGQAQALLCVAGVACCVAMAMPQVHIVAYCGDLGYGAARGAEMLSLMLGCGIVSRLVSGVICDRIGGLRTLLPGSVLQGLALLLFIPFDGLGRL